jgi:signal peptidase
MIVKSSELIPLVRDSLSNGQRVQLTAYGFSMLPFIRSGDIVELAPIQLPLSRGDVVLSESSAGHYTIHRIVRIRKNNLWLRGDTMLYSEGPISLQEVLGRAVKIYRSNHSFSLDSPLIKLAGFVWISLFPVGFYMIQFVMFLRKCRGYILQRLNHILLGLHRISFFRFLIKVFRPRYLIKEADQNDLSDLYSSPVSVSPYSTVYVARTKKVVIGSATLMRHPESDYPFTGYWLYGMEIKTRYRGMGVGSALTLRIIEKSRLEKATELFLFVFENNGPAIALYAKHGFEPTYMPAIDSKLADDVKLYGRRRVTWKKNLIRESTN